MDTSVNTEASTLENFFNPSSIAVLGASSREHSIGWRIIHNLVNNGYQGKIFPINPKHDQIAGIKAYSSITHVGDAPDMAFVALPAKDVANALEQCAQSGVKFIIVISAGFAESGDEGSRIQEYISSFALRTGIRVLGPNCQGMINFLDRIAVSFSGALDYGMRPGSTGLVSQSGALGHAIFNVANEEGLGLAFLVTTGNESDLDALDFLDYMIEDARVNTIAGYVEGFKRPELLMRIGEKSLCREKPVIMLKAGKSEVAKKAISSHTAALAGSNEIYGAVFRQGGIIRVNDLDELIDTATIFSSMEKFPEGERVAIFTTSGGTGVLLSDACSEFGLTVPELDPQTTEQLEKILPSFGSARNPVDITAQVTNNPGSFAQTLKIIAGDPGIDIIIIGMGMAVGKTAESRSKIIKEIAPEIGKPLVVTWVAGENAAGTGIRVLKDSGIPVYRNPWRCVRAVAHVVEYRKNVKKYRERKSSLKRPEEYFDSCRLADIKSQLAGESFILAEYDAKKILSGAGFTPVREKVAETADAAVEAANTIGYPVVLKINSPQVIHKTEYGGVKLNLKTENEVRGAFEEIVSNASNYNPQTEIKGVLVQEMLSGGVEVILGSIHDPQLGPVIMFGLGGIYVELAKDVAFRIPPLTRDQAFEMISETKMASAVLKGARGRSPVDILSLSETISRFSDLVASLGKGLEIDLNPLMALPDGRGTRIVDALIIKRPKSGCRRLI